MAVERFANNPIIRPADVKPSRPDFEVVGVMNAGAIRHGDQILLLLRVAECPPHGPEVAVAPVLDPDDLAAGIRLLEFSIDDPALDVVDRRVFRYEGQIYLTSISHLRLARSRDGERFTVDDPPAMVAATRDAEFGIEDPRITPLDDGYAINYTAVSRHGIATALATTRDFTQFQRRGLIFAPENRDVTIFPARVNGQYVCHHRPVTSGFGGPDIWLARSPDLIHWGRHVRVVGPRPGMWDSLKIGGGAVPIKTPQGWLSIYHGTDVNQRYALGLLLTDLENPARVIARSAEPILQPQADYETQGFFGHVVFTCGAVAEPDGQVLIYYGAADECMAGARTEVDALLATL